MSLQYRYCTVLYFTDKTTGCMEGASGDMAVPSVGAVMTASQLCMLHEDIQSN